MAIATTSELTEYYQNVQTNAHLLKPELAESWSRAVLWTLALNLGRGTKKKLADKLPDELAVQLKRPFWLVHFRDPNLSLHAFLKAVAKRAGHSDAAYARNPTRAVFHELKGFAGDQISHDVAEDLAEAVRTLWEQA